MATKYKAPCPDRPKVRPATPGELKVWEVSQASQQEDTDEFSSVTHSHTDGGFVVTRNGTRLATVYVDIGTAICAAMCYTYTGEGCHLAAVYAKEIDKDITRGVFPITCETCGAELEQVVLV